MYSESRRENSKTLSISITPLSTLITTAPYSFSTLLRSPGMPLISLSSKISKTFFFPLTTSMNLFKSRVSEKKRCNGSPISSIVSATAINASSLFNLFIEIFNPAIIEFLSKRSAHLSRTFLEFNSERNRNITITSKQPEKMTIILSRF
jgi:hypothetical protein